MSIHYYNGNSVWQKIKKITKNVRDSSVITLAGRRVRQKSWTADLNEYWNAIKYGVKFLTDRTLSDLNTVDYTYKNHNTADILSELHWSQWGTFLPQYRIIVLLIWFLQVKTEMTHQFASDKI